MESRRRTTETASRRWTVVVAVVAAVLAASSRAGAGAGQDIARVELVAPDDALVVDPVRSAAMLAAAGQRVPVVLRRIPGAADAAVSDFEAQFAQTRERFIEGLRTVFGRTVLETREIESLRFREQREAFQNTDQGFPVDLALAQVWAKGYEGEGWRRRLGAVLRSVMSECTIAEIQGDVAPFVVDVSQDEVLSSWAAMAPRAQAVGGAGVLPVGEAGRELRRRLESRDRACWSFLAGLLRPNVEEDPFLTALAMRGRFGDQVEARAYSRGEIIAQAGQPLDRWAGLAVEHFRRLGLSVERDSNMPAAEDAPNAAESGEPPQPAEIGRTRWLLPVSVGAAGGAFLVVGMWWARRRRSRGRALLTVGGDPLAPASDSRRTPIQRALLPHLAREMKDRLVGALFSQRQELLASEARASQRVAELEDRLAKLQPALAAKIRSYEQRIETLEHELAQKDQDTQDLIRAKIVLARKELDAEVQRSRVRWN